MLGSETLKRKITLRDERIFKMNIQLCSRTKKPRNFSESFIFLTIACSVCTSILHIFLQLYTNLFDIIDNRTILSSLYIAFKNLSLLKMLKTGGSTINLYLLFILHLRLFYLYLHKQNKNYSSTQGRWCNGNRKCQKKKNPTNVHCTPALCQALCSALGIQQQGIQKHMQCVTFQQLELF